ncbi:MAG: TDP-N-acetylfucosamine:lipid II N-acetylfucosaminyltransferase [Granulosicoccus sp.]|nr:TDP-N-acetylfucosamine:lipid II N-acetylfucosaminyltransferase [Granulosicoccus sp.]
MDKFIPSYIEFIKANPCEQQHRFYIENSGQNSYGIVEDTDVVILRNAQTILDMCAEMNRASKIILHSLWIPMACRYLLKNTLLLKKSFWVMWGAEYYYPEKKSDEIKFLIQQMGHCITYIDGDYQYVKKHYGATGRLHDCLLYSSNTFSGECSIPSDNNHINIQVGNSADPSNAHLEVFDLLKNNIDTNTNVFVPLSYGDNQYAARVVDYGRSRLGDRFFPLTEFVPYDVYKEHLASIDIAIFNHDRQQAMGNIVQFLGLGKKVILRKNLSHRTHLENQGLVIGDFDNDMTVNRLSVSDAQKNNKIISTLYSSEQLLRDWNNIFEFDLQAA